jgi:hypothetical protein
MSGQVSEVRQEFNNTNIYIEHAVYCLSKILSRVFVNIDTVLDN